MQPLLIVTMPLDLQVRSKFSPILALSNASFVKDDFFYCKQGQGNTTLVDASGNDVLLPELDGLALSSTTEFKAGYGFLVRTTDSYELYSLTLLLLFYQIPFLDRKFHPSIH